MFTFCGVFGYLTVKRKNKLPELLAPAGSFECLLAAIEAGADAVYIGGKKFGARAFAKNFDTDEIARAVSYAHLHGRKVYVTLNTLLLDREIPDAIEYARELYRAGVDALIVADLGLVSLIKKNIPDFELHASTQMSIHNSLGADEAFSLGCDRVVLARELSGESIAEVTAKCKCEIEVFLHGALCVCHSGQCLFSSLVGGRSGNRGECAQPCRLPYGEDSYPLSLTDLCLANHIRELCDSGVASLKIEGRMKSPDYVYRVTSIYRRLLDEYREATDGEMRELRAVFSRGGFTDKYFTSRLDEPMTGTRGNEDKSETRSLAQREYTVQKITVRAKGKFIVGKPSELTLWSKEKSVTVTGDAPTEAITQPLTKDALRERLSKTGQTLLSLAPEDIEITLSDGVNLSPKSINALRRAATEKFEYAGRSLENSPPEERAEKETSEYASTAVEVALSKAKIPEEKQDEKESADEPLRTTALFLNPEVYRRLEQSGDTRNIDVSFLPLMSTSDFGMARGVYLPPVITERELPLVRGKLKTLKNTRVTYALVGNLGHFSLAKEFSLIPIGDFRLNVTNSYTKDVCRSLGALDLILSVELTAPQARDVGGFTVQMGRIPLMLTERCFIKENFGCSACGTACLEDRMGERFPLLREFDHRNLILNSRITYMGDKRSELRAVGLEKAHFIFSTEDFNEARELLGAFEQESPIPYPHRRLGKRELPKPKPEKTHGSTAAEKSSKSVRTQINAKPQKAQNGERLSKGKGTEKRQKPEIRQRSKKANGIQPLAKKRISR